MSANLGDSNPNEVELNITPIIDCFTVLITFLLASASFLSIGFFEASTPGTHQSSEDTPDPDLEALVKVLPNRIVQINFKGKRTSSHKYDLKNKEDIELLTHDLGQLKESKLTLNSFLVSAEDSVDYKSLAETMGYLQKTEVPVVVGDF
jgi:biopolymer transport protein ExbD